MKNKINLSIEKELSLNFDILKESVINSYKNSKLKIKQNDSKILLLENNNSYLKLENDVYYFDIFDDPNNKYIDIKIKNLPKSSLFDSYKKKKVIRIPEKYLKETKLLLNAFLDKTLKYREFIHLRDELKLKILRENKHHIL